MPSCDAVRRRVPAGLKATCSTKPRCPSIAANWEARSDVPEPDHASVEAVAKKPVIRTEGRVHFVIAAVRRSRPNVPGFLAERHAGTDL